MSCQFSNLRVGDHVRLQMTGGNRLCDDCGYVSDGTGIVDCTYLGHVYSQRYGLLDVIQLDQPAACSSCGTLQYRRSWPCGDGDGTTHPAFTQRVVDLVSSLFGRRESG